MTPLTEEIVLKIFGNIWILWDIRRICTRNPIRSNRKTVRSLRSKYLKYDLLRERKERKKGIRGRRENARKKRERKKNEMKPLTEEIILKNIWNPIS